MKMYEGRLISNAHRGIFCQWSNVAMHAQCVLVATTLLHNGAKFHSFLYIDSRRVRVSMESCYGGMSTRLKQRAVTEFLSAENVTPAEIHRRLQAVYGENTVNRTTVNRWAKKNCPINSKQCRLPARFFWLFFGSHKDFTWQFLEAGNTVNSARYIETIKNLWRSVCRVRRSTSRILLLHDNARPHTARATIDALETLKFEVLSHPPYSPDLAPSHFYFFPHLKRDLKGTHFTSDDEVKQAVTSWIKQRTPEFFIDGMRKIVLRWEKCIEQGDYVEK